MSTIVLDKMVVRIPPGVDDLKSFRRWAHSEEFPDSGRICYLNGEVWVDMSKEQIFTHNQVKGEIAIVLGSLVKIDRLGRFFPDGVLLSNVSADLASQADGTFVSNEAFKAGRVRLVEGVEEGYVELEGTPDMLLEVVSPSSVEKDTVELRDLYWQAGIREYWLVDARGPRLAFDILYHSAKGYLATRKQGGWLKSAVFQRSFKLTHHTDHLGHPDYQLELSPPLK